MRGIGSLIGVVLGGRLVRCSGGDLCSARCGAEWGNWCVNTVAAIGKGGRLASVAAIGQ